MLALTELGRTRLSRINIRRFRACSKMPASPGSAWLLPKKAPAHALRLRGCYAARGRSGAPAALRGRSICDGANSFTTRTSLASRGTSAMPKPVFNARAFMGSLARNISAVRRRAPRLLARHSISAVSSVPIPLRANRLRPKSQIRIRADQA